MEPTTQLILREAFATAIEGANTSLTHPLFRDKPWSRVRKIASVEGAAMRTFLVRLLPGEPATGDDALCGDGWDEDAQLQVWVSYCHLPDDDDGPAISADARQLQCIFVDLPATVDGLHPTRYLGWTYVNDDPGEAYGYMTFACRYLVSDRADGGSLPP